MSPLLVTVLAAVSTTSTDAALWPYGRSTAAKTPLTVKKEVQSHSQVHPRPRIAPLAQPHRGSLSQFARPQLLYLEIHAAPWAPCKLEPLLL